MLKYSKEVVNLGRIFKISGNFKQDGIWANPIPAFSGEIVIDDNNMFHGYCFELYDAFFLSEINKTRFLVGAMAPNGANGKEGVVFYKLSNEPHQLPLIYIVPDLENGDGLWGGIVEDGDRLGVMVAGEAMIDTSETLKQGPKYEAEIKAKFNKLDATIFWNNSLLKQTQYCMDILTEMVLA